MTASGGTGDGWPRLLGVDEAVVSPIGLNAASFTSGCGAFDPDEAVAIIIELLSRTALVDATDPTGSRDVELLVGRAVHGRRDHALLVCRGDARPGHAAPACDATLSALRTDHIDLYCLRPVDAQVPLEDCVGTLATLVTAGKIRHIGLSDVDADQLRRAHAVHPVAMVAAEYSLLARRAEVEILPTARALGVGLAAYRPLGSGLLTGSLRSLDQLADGDYRRADPRFQPANFARARAQVRAVEALATRRQVSVARLAMAWLLARGRDIVPLPGTRNLTHLEMNLAAADVRLTADDQARLTSLAPEYGDAGSSPAGPDPEAGA